MLILTRRIGESIRINDDIEIIVLSPSKEHSNQMRLGITAPKEISVHREEIYQRILQEQNLTNREETIDGNR